MNWALGFDGASSELKKRIVPLSRLRLFFPLSSLESLFPMTDPVSSGLSQATGWLQDAAVLGPGALLSDQPATPTRAPLPFLGPFWRLLAPSSPCSSLELVSKRR